MDFKVANLNRVGGTSELQTIAPRIWLSPKLAVSEARVASLVSIPSDHTVSVAHKSRADERWFEVR